MNLEPKLPKMTPSYGSGYGGATKGMPGALASIYKIALKAPHMKMMHVSLRPTKFGFKSPGSFALPEHASGGSNE